MNIFSIIPGVLKAIGKITGLDIVNKAADALSTAQLTPEQQADLQKALIAETVQLRQLDIDELKTVMSESIAEIQSADKYVSRARPTGLYLFYLATFAITIALVLGVKVDSTAILATLGPLGGVGGTYVFRRTTEKLNGGGAE